MRTDLHQKTLISLHFSSNFLIVLFEKWPRKHTSSMESSEEWSRFQIHLFVLKVSALAELLFPFGFQLLHIFMSWRLGFNGASVDVRTDAKGISYSFLGILDVSC